MKRMIIVMAVAAVAAFSPLAFAHGSGRSFGRGHGSYGGGHRYYGGGYGYPSSLFFGGGNLYSYGYPGYGYWYGYPGYGASYYPERGYYGRRLHYRYQIGHRAFARRGHYRSRH